MRFASLIYQNPEQKLAGPAASQPELKTTCVSGRAAVARYLSRHAATDPAPPPDECC
jgi:hypothetical protein